jgi:hypothetical protein
MTSRTAGRGVNDANMQAGPRMPSVVGSVRSFALSCVCLSPAPQPLLAEPLHWDADLITDSGPDENEI